MQLTLAHGNRIIDVLEPIASVEDLLVEVDGAGEDLQTNAVVRTASGQVHQVNETRAEVVALIAAQGGGGA